LCIYTVRPPLAYTPPHFTFTVSLMALPTAGQCYLFFPLPLFFIFYPFTSALCPASFGFFSGTYLLDSPTLLCFSLFFDCSHSWGVGPSWRRGVLVHPRPGFFSPASLPFDSGLLFMSVSTLAVPRILSSLSPVVNEYCLVFFSVPTPQPYRVMRTPALLPLPTNPPSESSFPSYEVVFHFMPLSFCLYPAFPSDVIAFVFQTSPYPPSSCCGHSLSYIAHL